jgi:hypothetical protein
MINISNIKHGWLTLHINSHKFQASYITDVMEDITDLLVLEDYHVPKTIYVDGEGIELHLTAWRDYDYLILIWEEYGRNNEVTLDAFKLDFTEFCNKWKEVCDNIRDEYKNNFSLREEWD